MLTLLPESNLTSSIRHASHKYQAVSTSLIKNCKSHNFRPSDLHLIHRKMHIKLLHLGGFVATALTMKYPPHFKVGQEVTTTSVRVRGKAASIEREVSVYLGIPYAQSPVGDLRFAPPQKFTGSGRIDGTKLVSLRYSLN